MAGETLRDSGSFVEIIASAAVANAAFSAESSVISSVLTTGAEANYPLLDFWCSITSGTPAATGLINLYRRPKSDGTNKGIAPSASNKVQYVGSFVLAATAPTTYYYLFGVENCDPAATYYAENADGVSSLTFSVKVRARTYKANP